MKRIVFVIACFITLSCFARNKGDYEWLQLKSAPFQVDSTYLSKHDIVYWSPTQLECEGFPLGNGNIGGVIWNHKDGVELQINKNDLWDNMNPNEFNLSVLRHAARLKVDFGVPVFSWIHMQDFEGRLSLQKAEASFDSHTAYSATHVNSWIVKGDNVWVVECENIPIENDEPIVATVSLERIGSRSFSGWYGNGFPKDVKVGLGNTSSMINNKDMILCEKGNGLDFAVACRVIGSDNAPVEISNHKLEGKTQRKKFTVLVSVATSRECNDPAEEAVRLLDKVERSGVVDLKRQKDEWQKKFWSNSFVKTGDDYLENIYYLRRYLMAAGSLGDFPVSFNGGLWRWNRDVMNWVTPHHWNTQQQYWGLCAQNDCQLLTPYLNTYFNLIPAANELAIERGASSDAILLTEAHTFTGDQSSKNRGDMKNNLTPAAQVASIFYDYYDFTGDYEFLKNRAYVFMKKAAQFYLDVLQWDKERKEYYLMSSLYESAEIDHVKNSLSDRNCIEQLFSNCIQAAKILKVDHNKVKEWQHVLDHLWKRQYMLLEDSTEVISPAEQYFTQNRYTPWNWACGGMVAFPSNLLGIDEKDSRMGKAVLNFLKKNQNVNAHYPLAEIAARIGDGDEAERWIKKGLEANQIYPQGLMHNVTGYPDNIYDLASVHDLLDHSYTIRSKDFFQCGMEPISNYATAMNEMMLQSNEGKIRVFPTIPTSWNSTDIAFTLLARGAFVVSSEKKADSSVEQICIKSLQGKLCKVQIPWSVGEPFKIYSEGKPVKYQMDKKGVVRFNTKENKEYVIKLDSAVETEVSVYSGQKNMKVKRLGKRCIGKVSGWNDNLY